MREKAERGSKFLIVMRILNFLMTGSFFKGTRVRGGDSRGVCFEHVDAESSDCSTESANYVKQQEADARSERRLIEGQHSGEKRQRGHLVT